MSRDKSESQKGISLSGGCCVICGWNKVDYQKRSLVEGAHVRGFRNTSDYDKHDNIIGLCPNHHSEFDAGSLTIDAINKICIHIDKTDQFSDKMILGRIDHVKPGYFDYHNKHSYRG